MHKKLGIKWQQRRQ